MEEYRRNGQEGKTVFMGVDLHRFRWHVTVRTEDSELFSGVLPGRWEALRRLLDRYRGNSVQVVYEAGYFGFWLHDRVVAYGAECIVTPLTLLPQEYGNRVKTDRRANGYSLGNQRTRIEDFARAKDWPLTQVYGDRVCSAKDLEGRE